jgi:hypothetical protein
MDFTVPTHLNNEDRATLHTAINYLSQIAEALKKETKWLNAQVRHAKEFGFTADDEPGCITVFFEKKHLNTHKANVRKTAEVAKEMADDLRKIAGEPSGDVIAVYSGIAGKTTIISAAGTTIRETNEHDGKMRFYVEMREAGGGVDLIGMYASHDEALKIAHGFGGDYIVNDEVGAIPF